MANDPKPITITRVATGAYTGSQTPQPFLMVGDPLADPVASDADVSALVDDTESDTRASLDAVYEAQADLDTDVAALVADTESDTYAAIDALTVAAVDADIAALVDNPASDTSASLDALYDFATVAAAFTGYSGAATQTLKNVSGTMTWVTDGG